MDLPFDTKAENEKLAAMRTAEEEDLVRILSEKYGIGYADLTASPIDMDALRLVTEADARAAEAVPFKKDVKHVSLALHNPQNDKMREMLAALTERGFVVEQYLISKQSLEKTLERYQELSMASTSAAGIFTITKDERDRLRTELKDVTGARHHLQQALADKKGARISELLEGILAAALALRASDIHLEPEEDGIRMRFRIDGVLMDVLTFDEHTYRFLNSRIKLLSGLKLNIRDRAQDGRFSIIVADTEVEVRTSLIPGNYGESFVMRVLDPASLGLGFEQLGIHPKLLKRLESEITRPNGMLLTTGPTGSGKTTTLYSFLKKIHTPDIKIITLEDPIEYHLPGIVQTQVDKEYDFSSGLRSIVRQDPDVIMVGEIRDRETVETAIQAALTGHFVFSTLHTNDAAGTFPRLVDLGADPREFASAITVVMAQRLVRRLDPNTRKQMPLLGEQKALVDKVLAGIVDRTLVPTETSHIWVPDTAQEAESGYRGRVGLYEAIFMDDGLGEFLRNNPSSGEIRKEAKRQGYLSMLEDGVLKALAGETSLEEVMATVDLPHE